MRPALQRSSPATARSSEVLPQPEGPINTPISPGRQAEAGGFDRGAAVALAVAHGDGIDLQEHAPIIATAAE